LLFWLYCFLQPYRLISLQIAILFFMMTTIMVIFRSGIFSRQCYLTSEVSPNSLRNLAKEFILEKYPSSDDISEKTLDSRLLLFKHDVHSMNILQLITDYNDINDGTVIEIVISPTPQNDRIFVYPHSLYVHSYRTPTFCDFCGEMLFGLVKQGLKCNACNLNYHKRCARKIPNNCSGSYQWKTTLLSLPNADRSRQPSLVTASPVEENPSDDNQPVIKITTPSTTTTTPEILITSADMARQYDVVSPTLSFTPRKDRSSSWSGRPLWMEVENARRTKVPHTFQVHTYTKPTICHYCKKLLKGIVRQGMQCRDCCYNCHKKCEQYVPKDCSGSMLQSASALFDDDEYSAESSCPSVNGETNDAQFLPESKTPARYTNSAQDYSDNDSTSIEQMSQNIPVMRLIMTKRQTKASNKIIKTGWIVHHTQRNHLRRKHYWCLSSKSIVMYTDNHCVRRYREIPLHHILCIERGNFQAPLFGLAGSNPVRRLELRTITSTYYIDFQDCLNNKEATEWETAIRQAWMPMSPYDKKPSPTDDNSANNTESSAAEKNALEMCCKSEEDFCQTYQIFMEEMLGSGQFGIVYGAIHRKSGRHVAVKIINKKKFPSNRESALRTEVKITQKLKHEGIIQFESVMETPERIYVVMEKLKGDMLEMILNSQKGRLNERITKFLITQVINFVYDTILAALQYLHGQNVVHCDLKPENILLVTNSDFPQIKLCDFGFARIIGERSFRRSIVGTPAYLAPEVLQNKGFNRSLDMWSVGVITYVALSGTFPFNEDEDITDQIKNAAFMFPSHPWSDISQIAIDFIQSMLQVKISRRFSVQKALLHPWLQSRQLWSDLRTLEKSIGSRYLTHESDDERWENCKEP
ncbi:Serine/threonine-protein kinase dkf-2, partial [Trichinella pseudospiralis]